MRKSTQSEGKLELRFNVIVERQEDGAYQAHCLELDLVAEGDTVEEACSEIKDAIDVHVRTCIQNDNMAHMFSPAPQEVWSKFGPLQVKATYLSHDRVSYHTTDDQNHRSIEVDHYCYA